jgi:DNA topoisomerase-2
VGPQGAVKKYESPEEILVDYVEIRIGMYKKRKAWLLKELDAEILWLSEKARFIRGVADESIPIMNAPLQQIENRLKTLHFSEDIWPKLFDIKTYQYTKEEVERLLALCERHVQERDQLKKTSAIQLWKNNLNDL